MPMAKPTWLWEPIGYSSNTGRAYLFYNDGAIPTTAATADVMITGEATNNYFGNSLAAGDFNADGKTDLAVGARVIPPTPAGCISMKLGTISPGSLQSQSSLSGGLRVSPSFSGQELKVTGEVGAGQFGSALATGDFNADGKIDLAVGASKGIPNTGRVYLFYSDGSLASAATNADVVITGEATSDYFGYSLTSGDFNADGKIDLAVGPLVIPPILAALISSTTMAVSPLPLPLLMSLLPVKRTSTFLAFSHFRRFQC
jgi:hypothetical protein